MPRQRTVRLAVLGSSVQRAAAPRYPSRSRSAARRRAVVGVLVVLSLALVTASFRGDALAGPQDAASSALRPFQVAAQRVARPFEDAYRWSAGLVRARAQVSELRQQLAQARQEAAQYRDAWDQVAQLKAVAGYRAPPGFPEGFLQVPTAVLDPPDPFDQEIVVAAGRRDGVREDAPVITPAGLVGTVTRVTRDTAKVRLLTDPQSAVRAKTQSTRRGVPPARGVVRAGSGETALSLDQVQKDLDVRAGDRVVTSGSERGELPSHYPRGIPVGVVTYAGQVDTEPWQRIQVKAFVDFDTLDSVIVLVPRTVLR